MLQIINLKKKFGGIKAVNDCTFNIKKNNITALIGQNGSGKSTIFNLISGILIPDEGIIIFDKEKITGKTIHKIAQKGISRLFQRSRMFNNLTVNENIQIASDEQNTLFWKNLFNLNKQKGIKKRINKSLQYLEIKKIRNKRIDELSYGQKRLAELARTISMPHKLLLLDEPVSGIHPQLREKIKKILLSLKKQGETILFIEHDMKFTLEIADEIIVMNEGRVIAKGTPEEIKENPEVLTAYFGD